VGKQKKNTGRNPGFDRVLASEEDVLLKTVAFNAGKKNSVVQKKFIRFSIENLIANISF
jgi:hypothetical protein